MEETCQDRTNHMSVSFLSQPVNIGLARVTVACFASQLDLTLSDLEEIKVSVSEAVSNAIVHGYQRAPGELIKIEANIWDNSILEIIVEDSGAGFAGPLPEEESEESERVRLGFMLMRSFMDSVEVNSAPGQGTRVVMRKDTKGKTTTKNIITCAT